MSRVEENAKLNCPGSFKSDLQVQIAQAKFLEDISRSLAVIADSMETIEKYYTTKNKGIGDLLAEKEEQFCHTCMGQEYWESRTKED